MHTFRGNASLVQGTRPDQHERYLQQLKNMTRYDHMFDERAMQQTLRDVWTLATDYDKQIQFLEYVGFSKKEATELLFVLSATTTIASMGSGFGKIMRNTFSIKDFLMNDGELLGSSVNLVEHLNGNESSFNFPGPQMNLEAYLMQKDPTLFVLYVMVKEAFTPDRPTVSEQSSLGSLNPNDYSLMPPGSDKFFEDMMERLQEMEQEMKEMSSAPSRRDMPVRHTPSNGGGRRHRRDSDYYRDITPADIDRAPRVDYTPDPDRDTYVA